MKKLAVGTPVWFVTPDKIRRTGEVARYRGSDAVVSVDSGTFYMVPPEEIRLPEPERAPRVIRQEGRVVRADIRQLRDPSPLTGDDWSLSLEYSAGFGTPSRLARTRLHEWASGLVESRGVGISQCPRPFPNC